MRNMTRLQLVEKAHELGMNPHDVAYWNPGLFRRALEEHGVDPNAIHEDDFASPGVQQALKAATTPQDSAFENGWAAIPKDAYDAIYEATKHSSAPARAYDIAKGKASRYLLGSSPSWLAFQVGANTLQVATATGMRLPAQLIKQSVWYRRLSDAHEAAVDGAIGTHGMHDVQTPHLGAAANHWSSSATAPSRPCLSGTSGAGEHGPTVRALNPIEGMLQLDRLQTNAFRRAVFLNKAEGDALRRVGGADGPRPTSCRAAASDLLSLKQLRPCFATGPRSRSTRRP